MLNVEYGPTAIPPTPKRPKRSLRPSRSVSDRALSRAYVPGSSRASRVAIPAARTVGGRWEAPPDDLAEADHVGLHAGAGDGASGAFHPEAGHDLVVDEDETEVLRGLPEALEELRVAGDEPPLDGLDDDGRKVRPLGSQQLRRVLEVVIREDEDLAEGLGGGADGLGDRDRRGRGPRARHRRRQGHADLAGGPAGGA